MRGLFIILLFCLALVARGDEPAIHIDRIAVNVNGTGCPAIIRTRASEDGSGVWEKWGAETNRVFTNLLFLPKGGWHVFAARNGHRWHFVRTAPQGLFQFRYARGVSAPVLQLLFIKAREN